MSTRQTTIAALAALLLTTAEAEANCTAWKDQANSLIRAYNAAKQRVADAQSGTGYAPYCQAMEETLRISDRLLPILRQLQTCSGMDSEDASAKIPDENRRNRDGLAKCWANARAQQPSPSGGAPQPGPDPSDPRTCFELNTSFARTGSQYAYRGENSCRFPVTYVVEECNADRSATGSPVTCKQSSPKRLSAESKDFIQYNDGKQARLITVCNATSGRCYATDR